MRRKSISQWFNQFFVVIYCYIPILKLHCDKCYVNEFGFDKRIWCRLILLDTMMKFIFVFLGNIVTGERRWVYLNLCDNRNLGNSCEILEWNFPRLTFFGIFPKSSFWSTFLRILQKYFSGWYSSKHRKTHRSGSTFQILHALKILISADIDIVRNINTKN